MRISSFLTFIIFCFLLYLEWISEENEAYGTLSGDIRKLLFRIVDLQYDINKHKITITGANDYKIVEKIGELKKLMEHALTDLGDKVPGQEIEKNINISSQKAEALGYLLPFSPRSTHDSSKLLDNLEQTFKILGESDTDESL